jgi:hypothetical protein
MNQAKYQITLSLNGNHQVSVFGDDPTSVKEGLAWARGIYLKLKERSDQQALSPSAEVVHHDISSEQAPTCAIHRKPMTWVPKGKRGPFWSCHEKLDDGSWCPYKPSKA